MTPTLPWCGGLAPGHSVPRAVVEGSSSERSSASSDSQKPTWLKTCQQPSVSQPGCGSLWSDGPVVWRDATPGSRVPGRPVPRGTVAPGGKVRSDISPERRTGWLTVLSCQGYKVVLSTVSWTREVSWARRTARRAPGQWRAKSAATRSASGSGCWGSGPRSVHPPSHCISLSVFSNENSIEFVPLKVPSWLLS